MTDEELLEAWKRGELVVTEDDDFLAASARAKETIAAQNEWLSSEVKKRGKPIGDAFEQALRRLDGDT